MVNAVPSSPTVPSPARVTTSAVTSARCSSGIPTARCTWSATLCIVFVHSSSRSAPSRLESLRRLSKQLASFVPLPCDLQALDIGEVDRHQDHTSRVQSTKALSHELVGQPVVLGAALPTHATKHPDHTLTVHRHDNILSATHSPDTTNPINLMSAPGVKGLVPLPLASPRTPSVTKPLPAEPVDAYPLDIERQRFPIHI